MGLDGGELGVLGHCRSRGLGRRGYLEIEIAIPKMLHIEEMGESDAEKEDEDEEEEYEEEEKEKEE